MNIIMNRTNGNGSLCYRLGDRVTVIDCYTRISDGLTRRGADIISVGVTMHTHKPPYKLEFSRARGGVMVEPPCGKKRPARPHEIRALLGTLHEATEDARKGEDALRGKARRDAIKLFDRLTQITELVENALR
jgi:hypothetical protein